MRAISGGWLIRIIIYVALGAFSIFVLMRTLGGGKAREGSSSTCAARLSMIGKAMAIYAYQYNDQLPDVGAVGGGAWMCDEPAAILDLLAAMPIGSTLPMDLKKTMFCQANARQDPAALLGAPGAAYRTTGFVLLNERRGSLMPRLAGLPEREPPLIYHSKFLDTPNAAKSELALDWIISPALDPATTVWTGTTARGRPGVYDTSHMKSDTRPSGGNVLYFDGHVKFQTIDPAKAIAVQQGGGSSAPYFWFPNP